MNKGYLQKRFGAAFIDLVLIGAVFVLINVPFAILPQILFFPLSGLISLFFGFIILMKDGPYGVQNLLDKQSPGKKYMNLRVTQLDGKTPISWSESSKRNLPLALSYFINALAIPLNIIPVFGGLICAIIMFGGGLLGFGIILYESFRIWKDPEARRWGDYMALTKVIEE